MPASPARSRTSSSPGSSRGPTGPGGRWSMIDPVREVLAGREAWIVGGAVRDELLGRPVVDLDVACRAPESAARDFARRGGGAPFPLSERHGARRVVVGEGPTVAFPPLPGSIEEGLGGGRRAGAAGRVAGTGRPGRRRRRAGVPDRCLSWRQCRCPADLPRAPPLRDQAAADGAARGRLAARDPPLPARDRAMGARG